MAGRSQYRVEHVAQTPRGWKVRSKREGGHVLRIAFPPGRRKQGAGEIVEILHPKTESNPCSNPLVIDMLNPTEKKNPLDAEALARIAKAAERRGLALANSAELSVAEDEGKAVELYHTFHGRDPKRVIELAESEEIRGTYTSLGKLAELQFITPARQRIKLDFYAEGTKLASNPEGTQLYLIGGDQSLDDGLDKFGSDTSKDFVDLGECVYVVYIARKSQTDFREAGWKHKFGEEGGQRPWGFYDRIRRKIYLVGGDYKVEAPGIVN